VHDQAPSRAVFGCRFLVCLARGRPSRTMGVARLRRNTVLRSARKVRAARAWRLWPRPARGCNPRRATSVHSRGWRLARLAGHGTKGVNPDALKCRTVFETRGRKYRPIAGRASPIRCGGRSSQTTSRPTNSSKSIEGRYLSLPFEYDLVTVCKYRHRAAPK
jgi:hypothetical protein